MKTIATSKTRISQSAAHIIARKVANAAFEHIAKPLVKKSDNLIIHHYKTFFERQQRRRPHKQPATEFNSCSSSNANE